MLKKGDAVPHFTVTTIEDRSISYPEIWQRRNLVLIVLPAVRCDSSDAYVADLSRLMPTFRGQNSECVVTRDRVAGIPCPAAVVADKWGEIVYIATASAVVDLPPAEEMADWVSYLQTRCPECEGEAR